jgi:nucleoid DNA-binding protein
VTLTKGQIVEQVAQRLNCSKTEAAALVESFFEELTISARRVISFRASPVLRRSLAAPATAPNLQRVATRS